MQATSAGTAHNKPTHLDLATLLTWETNSACSQEPQSSCLTQSSLAHRKCATSHIPASQQTRFPASWANYLCQEPRILWHADTHQLISEFAGWTMAEYHNKQEQLPANRKRTFQDMETKTTDDTNPENATLTMRNGKVQKLYDYLSWMIREYGYSTREDLVNGALSHGTSDNFSRALIHPHFDTILTKAFCMDRAVKSTRPSKSCSRRWTGVSSKPINTSPKK